MSERAIFFDRDGTVNVEKEYIYDPGQVELIDGALEALTMAKSKGFRIFIISNQSGNCTGFGD